MAPEHVIPFLIAIGVLAAEVLGLRSIHQIRAILGGKPGFAAATIILALGSAVVFMQGVVTFDLFLIAFIPVETVTLRVELVAVAQLIMAGTMVWSVMMARHLDD